MYRATEIKAGEQVRYTDKGGGHQQATIVSLDNDTAVIRLQTGRGYHNATAPVRSLKPIFVKTEGGPSFVARGGCP